MRNRKESSVLATIGPRVQTCESKSITRRDRHTRLSKLGEKRRKKERGREMYREKETEREIKVERKE